ncbi:MAG: hypothetical protein HYT87_10605 [Nitrospirae bacterium]|nr:hypothetical protein [Nitrospirota bacterium]
MKNIRAQIEILLQLQEVDVRIQQMRDAKERIPRELDINRSELELCSQTTEDARQALAKHEAEQKAIEHEIQLEKEQIQRYEERVSQIKTNKEYQAMLKEISVAKKMKEESEDELLKTMMLLDESRRLVTQRQGESAGKEKEFKEKEAELLRKLAEVDKDINGVVDGRNRLAAQVDRSLLQKYDMIRQKREGIAVSKAANELCLACHRNIPPQLYNEILKDDTLIACPNCQRILYYEGPSEAAPSKAASQA